MGRFTCCDSGCEALSKPNKWKGNPTMEHSSARIIKNKLGLLNLAAELGNGSKACKVMGFSRDTFYRYKDAIDAGGIEALIDKNRRSRTPGTVSTRLPNPPRWRSRPN